MSLGPLFVSLAVVALALVAVGKNPWHYLLAGPVVAFAGMVRPHGVSVLLAVLVYALFALRNNRRYGALTVLGLCIAASAPVAVSLIGRMLSHEQIIEHYAGGTVIWGYEAGLKMPGELHPLVSSTGNPFYQILLFLLDKPAYFLHLAASKLWHLYLHARPYYSARHNVLLVATLFPIYAVALLGLFRPARPVAVKLLVGAVIVFQSLIVSLTFADWDGRDLLIILPFMFIFTGAGASGIAAFVVKKFGKRSAGLP